MDLRKRFKGWKAEIKNHKYLILLSLVFLVLATFLDYFAGSYVRKVGSAVSPDLILDHIAPINLSFLFVYGYITIILILFLYPLLFKVRKFHMVISQFSLLIMVRSFFIIFTHLKTPVDAIAVKFPWMISYLSFQNDLFFSGHTAVPFLGFLIFKGRIRYFFLAASIAMGAIVLLMHLHYSIDVLSAFFITYGTYKIGVWFFKKINHY
jgi:hypothetical protein